MNRLECSLVLGTLHSAFPSFYRDMNKKQVAGISALWEKMFEDDDFQAVMAAVQALISTRIESFPPTIGEVKERLRMIKTPNDLSEQEAWAMVSKACQNGYYHAVEEFEKLPEVIRRSIGSADQLKVWAQMDSATVESVVASNFMRTFRVKKAQQKELDMMPTEVKQYMAAVAEKMRIDSGEQKQIEQPKEKLLPAPLEPLKKMDEIVKEITPQPNGTYKPLTESEFEKRREEMLQKLETTQKEEAS